MCCSHGLGGYVWSRHRSRGFGRLGQHLLQQRGGSIGGGYARPAIRDAALHAVSIASKFLDGMQLTDNFPLPENGGVIFYIVTERGVFMAKASVVLLSTNRHPLSELGNCMQTIITEYRMLETTVQ